MRIAIWHGLHGGGARRALDCLTRPLAGRHQLETYVLQSTKHHDLGWSPSPCHVVRQKRRPHVRGASYWNDWLSLLDLRDLQRLEKRLAHQLDSAGFDVVLASTLPSGQAPGALRYLSTPTAYYCHEPPRRFSEPWCRPEAGPLSAFERLRHCYRWPAQTLLEEIVRRRDIRHVRRSTVVLTNSRYTQQRVRDIYGRDANVCYLGVAAELFHPAGEVVRDRVIGVGSLEAHKGFDFIVRALGRIPEQRRPAFTIVGGGGHPSMPAHLHQVAAAAGVRLEILSGVSDDELARLYRRHALFVFGARFEPFGLVLLEAQASGLPVVAVNEGGVPESVRDEETGFLVSRDEHAFAQAVDRLLSDDRLLAEMSRNAVSHAGQWSWQAAGERLEQHLEDLACAPPRRPAPASVAAYGGVV